MSIAYQLKLPAFTGAVLLLFSLLLGGCASSTVSSSSMDARADARAEVSASRKTSAYPAVHDLPPKREMSATMSPADRSRLTQELLAARDHQAAAAKAQGGPLNPINR